MQKRDYLALFLIAVCALFFGYKLAQGLGDSGHVATSTAGVDWDVFTQKMEQQSADDHDLYLIAQQWEWTPQLELKAGVQYRLHIASRDIQHGFHLEKSATGMPIDILLQPERVYILPLKIEQEGQYAIGCTQYCGIAHNKMRGYLVVRK